jgi:hypothetical protein
VPDCYLGLRLDSDDTEATGVQVVAPPRFSTGRVPQPDGMVLYELVIGHPEPGGMVKSCGSPVLPDHAATFALAVWLITSLLGCASVGTA